MSCRDAPCHQSCSVCGKSHCTTNHGGGGGGGNGGDPPPPDPPTPEPGIVEEVPCTPEDEALSTRTSEIEAYFGEGMREFIRLHQKSAWEYSRTLNYDPVQNKWLPSDITTDNKTNSVTQNYNANSKAFIHNHPIDHNAHSMTDVVCLAQANSIVPELKTSFVVSSDDSIYALVIEDSSKAAAFYNAQKDNKENLDDEYGRLMGKMFLVATYDIYSVHALAYMLEKYDTGMTIMKYEENVGYRTRHSEMTRNEEGLVTHAKLTKCK